MNIFKFNSLIPELSVTDILKTRHFYVNVLGFEICYERKEDNFIFVRYEDNIKVSETGKNRKTPGGI